MLYIHNEKPYAIPTKNSIFSQEGFSLLEICITLVLIGLLFSFAIPNYTRYLVQTKRLEGQTALIQMSYLLEAHYTRKKTYAGNVIGKNAYLHKYYALHVRKATKTGYMLEAHAQFSDPACPILRLDSIGRKTPLACWG